MLLLFQKPPETAALHESDNMAQIADLHSHTVYSDGMDEPEILLKKAREAGVAYLGVTDHDTTRWLGEEGILLQKEGKSLDLSILRGLEISACDERTGKKVHILGYWPGSAPFITPRVDAICSETGRRRTETALIQIEILSSLGFDIREEDVRKDSRGDMIFKNDIVKTCERKGLIRGNRGDFYIKHFKKGGVCYRSIPYVSAVSAVEAIFLDGGKAVLAHPGQQDNLYFLPALKEAGLWGIEKYHPTHTPFWEEKVNAAASELSLFVTGGSDYHGIVSSSRKLGSAVFSEKEMESLRDAGLL